VFALAHQTSLPCPRSTGCSTTFRPGRPNVTTAPQIGVIECGCNSTTTAAGEAAPAPGRATSRHGAVAMCELADRLGDTLHRTARNGVSVPVMLSIGDERAQCLTGVFVAGGCIHLRAGVRW
jgi:hypothetical protein